MIPYSDPQTRLTMARVDADRRRSDVREARQWLRWPRRARLSG